MNFPFEMEKVSFIELYMPLKTIAMHCINRKMGRVITHVSMQFWKSRINCFKFKFTPCVYSLLFNCGVGNFSTVANAAIFPTG